MLSAAPAVHTGRTRLARDIVRQAGPKHIAVRIKVDGSQATRVAPHPKLALRDLQFDRADPLIALTRLTQIGKNIGGDL
ncbi:MAG TPA: hypothetical protein VJT49_28190 [Amycolatopsis sp.]|uniref:hypothetical protein n=1 Tax=Amycolatopsis sp. TaxID=37632 RepID=UPI002B4772DD|nr:hypothetical protein [Amycolatopsis sp.]HKS48918.1 hypothetical protein [Amycolatopsis sp.]